MKDALPAPEIRAALNGAGELELTAVDAPAGAVIRMDLNADSPRMLCTQGQYLAPVQAPPGTCVRYRLFLGKRGMTEPETFVMPGTPPVPPLPSTLVPCTQNRDFLIYDWAARHEAVCRRVRETQPDLLFIGDSITHFWGGEPKGPSRRGLETWEKIMRPAGFHNLGFGFDRIENVLWRVYHGELDGYKAEEVVLMIGTNNLGICSDNEIVEGLRFLLSAIRQRQPEARIKVIGILPRHDQESRVKNINRRIRQMAQTAGYTFSDPGRNLLLKDGKLDESLFSDGLHPNEEGYKRIVEEIVN